MKSTTLSSPARTCCLRFVVHSAESVEVIETRWNGGSTSQATERWISEPEAANYRASLIHKGWTESISYSVRD